MNDPNLEGKPAPDISTEEFHRLYGRRDTGRGDVENKLNALLQRNTASGGQRPAEGDSSASVDTAPQKNEQILAEEQELLKVFGSFLERVLAAPYFAEKSEPAIRCIRGKRRTGGLGLQEVAQSFLELYWWEGEKTIFKDQHGFSLGLTDIESPQVVVQWGNGVKQRVIEFAGWETSVEELLLKALSSPEICKYKLRGGEDGLVSRKTVLSRPDVSGKTKRKNDE